MRAGWGNFAQPALAATAARLPEPRFDVNGCSPTAVAFGRHGREGDDWDNRADATPSCADRAVTSCGGTGSQAGARPGWGSGPVAGRCRRVRLRQLSWSGGGRRGRSVNVEDEAVRTGPLVAAPPRPDEGQNRRPVSKPRRSVDVGDDWPVEGPPVGDAWEEEASGAGGAGTIAWRNPGPARTASRSDLAGGRARPAAQFEVADSRSAAVKYAGDFNLPVVPHRRGAEAASECRSFGPRRHQLTEARGRGPVRCAAAGTARLTDGSSPPSSAA